MTKLMVLDIEKLKKKANSNELTERGFLKDTIQKARNILLILERDKFMCVQCGCTKDLTIDHLQHPKYRNAYYYRPNKCKTLCEKCHIKKNMEKK